MRQDARMRGGNKFKLGVFASNCSGGLAMTKAPERWVPSWENNLALARLAESIGMEFMLPVARWHGYGGETDTEGTALETLTWATGLLGGTREIVVFGTVHAPLINPIFAAKQCVTADHIGFGRFGLNIVSGWSESEFRMFGVPLREHDERYAYTEEWLTILRRVWEESEPFDFSGRYFDLKGVLSRPKPWGGGRPLLLSAGSSPAGRAFAARHADCLFMAFIEIDTLADQLAALRTMAGARRIGVFSSGHIVCRPTQREAEEYHRYIVHDMGDWDAVDNLLKVRGQQRSVPTEQLAKVRESLVSGLGTYLIVGSPDHVTDVFRRMSAAGLDGVALGYVNYLNELPLMRDEVIPRMERIGLRTPPASGS